MSFCRLEHCRLFTASPNRTCCSLSSRPVETLKAPIRQQPFRRRPTTPSRRSSSWLGGSKDCRLKSVSCCQTFIGAKTPKWRTRLSSSPAPAPALEPPSPSTSARSATGSWPSSPGVSSGKNFNSFGREKF